jgi:ubiquinone/menaquinone biosynthesis C-methylase UbiE
MLSFQAADGKALPFPASTFDVVVLHTVLTHVPSPDALLAEVFRVLRPQGRSRAWRSVPHGILAAPTRALMGGIAKRVRNPS